MLNPVLRKILTILFLGALFAVALQWIRGVVVERQSRQQEVESGIAAGIGGRQTVVGPVLLVIGLSEHIAFALAYSAAGTACVALITVYLRHVLGGWRRALAFGALLALLYGVLYGLLLSEDNALVLGSLLLFALLAAAMWLTRRVDWYTAHAAQP